MTPYCCFTSPTVFDAQCDEARSPQKSNGSAPKIKKIEINSKRKKLIMYSQLISTCIRIGDIIKMQNNGLS